MFHGLCQFAPDFCAFHWHIKSSTKWIKNDKTIDGVLGTRTRGGRMEGADKSTELWRHPTKVYTYIAFSKANILNEALEAIIVSK